MTDDSLRAGDADREATVARLQSAFTEGRLELAELDERTAAAYAAKTLGDLAGLTRDLPEQSSAPVLRPAASEPERPKPQVNELWRFLQYGLPPVVVINFFVWLGIGLASGWVYPWWIWIIVAWACGAFGGPGRRGRRGHGRPGHDRPGHDRFRGPDGRHDRLRRDRDEDDEDDDDDGPPLRS